MMESIKGITKATFLTYFDLLKKGNPETAWNEFAYAVYAHKDFATGQPVDPQYILNQWKAYAEACVTNKTAPQFQKSMDKWIKAKDYQVEYKPKGASYLDRYKKKPTP